MIYEKIVDKINDKVTLDGYFKSSDGLETIFFKRLKYKQDDSKADINLNFQSFHLLAVASFAPKKIFVKYAGYGRLCDAGRYAR